MLEERLLWWTKRRVIRVIAKIRRVIQIRRAVLVGLTMVRRRRPGPKRS